MKLANKACIAVSLGAARELKDQVAKPYSSALKRSLSRVGSSATEARLLASTPNKPKTDFRPQDAKDVAAQESLRMVMYLSCWGPN
ncbi:hypothetical protein COCNU_06G010040 [Cocos nucifera]|uniref:Wound induced protein n=1 Tax=Cocos nucifera TaxID=13894 RepID=A0A8K0IBY2_COCNU|nr:hypothetical protein COCNU_06G010040 [Cocos nucifera]